MISNLCQNNINLFLNFLNCTVLHKTGFSVLVTCTILDYRPYFFTVAPQESILLDCTHNISIFKICQLNLCATVKNRPIFTTFCKHSDIKKTLENTGFPRVLMFF
nr:MAG TPA: hypothetical protein [Caudoviricetes sp.]